MQPESDDIDKFQIIHLVEWIIFGYFFPNKHLLAFIIMILWELFETIISSDEYLYNLFKKYWTFTSSKYWNETNTNKLLDMVMNILGYYIGSSIRTDIR